MRHLKKYLNLTSACTSLPETFSGDFTTLLHNFNSQMWHFLSILEVLFLLICFGQMTPHSIVRFQNHQTLEFFLVKRGSVYCQFIVLCIQHSVLLLMTFHSQLRCTQAVFLALKNLPVQPITGLESTLTCILASPLSINLIDYVPGQIQSIFTHGLIFMDKVFTHTFCDIA